MKNLCGMKSLSGVFAAGALLAGGLLWTSCGGDDKTEADIAVNGVSVSLTTLSLGEGETARLSASVTPENASDKTVSWTSSDESVASVGSNGEVTGVKAGSATITVTTKDGGFNAVCNITVTNVMYVDGIFYQRVSDGSTEVMVTNKAGGYQFDENDNCYNGSVKVPSSINFKGVTYTVKQVGAWAFYGCGSLTSVTLPEGLTDIESRAFGYCENLKTLSLPASLIFINCLNPVFEGCKKLDISVAAGGVFKMADGLLCGNYWSHNRLVWLQENKTGEVSVPEGITCINSDAMDGSAMTKITVPATVEYLSGRNFNYCANLKEVVLRWNEAQLGKLIYEPNVATFYFTGTAYSGITVRVPKGTKAAYEAHKLWGMGFKITE